MYHVYKSQTKAKMGYCCRIEAGTAQLSLYSLERIHKRFNDLVFHPTIPLLIAETLLDNRYSISIFMEDIGVNYNHWVHPYKPSQLGSTMPYTLNRLILLLVIPHSDKEIHSDRLFLTVTLFDLLL